MIKKIFQIDEKSTSYKNSILRGIFSFIALALSLAIRFTLKVESIWLEIIIAVPCVLICVVSIASLIIASVDRMTVAENRAKQKLKTRGIKVERCMQKAKQELLDLCEREWITEIILSVDGKPYFVGTTAISDAGESKFHSKEYYIDTKNFKTIEDFREKLDKLVGESVYVYSIDGIKIKKQQK